MSERMPSRMKAAPTPSFTPVRSGLLQRKCACGGLPGIAGECTEGNNKQLKVQRRTATHAEPATVPPIVHEVLRSPGQMLDTRTRVFMEPRFGHDFSRVRVHTGARASQSAWAINANAYTVGSDIVFGNKQYAPHTPAGQRLLAHELTHTIQQAGVSSPHGVKLGSQGDVMEHEADGIANNILQTGQPVTLHLPQREPTIQRQVDTIDIDLAPTDPQEVERLRRMGINLPQVGPKTWAAIGGGGNHANQPLNDPERTTIAQLTKTGAPSSPLALPEGARFVLHDTVGETSAERIKEHKKLGRGPLAETGASAFVPAAGAETVTRDVGLFDPHRPSVTEFEKGEDIMNKTDREGEYRKVWRATNSKEQDAALDRALDNQGLTEGKKGEKSKEQTQARKELKAIFRNSFYYGRVGGL